MQLPVCRQCLAPPPAPASKGQRSYWQTGQEPGRVSERGEQEQQAERGRDTRDREEEQVRERLVLREKKKQRELKEDDARDWKQEWRVETEKCTKLQKHTLRRRDANVQTSLMLPLGPLWPQAEWKLRKVLVFQVRMERHRSRSCCGCGPRHVCTLPWFLKTAAVDAAGGSVKKVLMSTPESWAPSPLLAEHQSGEPDTEKSPMITSPKHYLCPFIVDIKCI